MSLPAMRADFMLREVGASGVLLVLALTGCASSPSAAPQPATEPPRGLCGNAFFHEQFERELATAQAEPEPEKRAAAVCEVAHNWGIEDCSNVTPRSLDMP